MTDTKLHIDFAAGGEGRARACARSRQRFGMARDRACGEVE